MSAIWSKRISRSVVADIIVEYREKYIIKRVVLHVNTSPVAMELILSDKEVDALEKLFEEAREGVVNNRSHEQD